ncbi:MAG: flagellar motor protein MotB [Moraxellaceae bacterium]|nr:MAG: flagellar motor protein MotB [Moraxellaceae bacterium]
MVRRKNNEIHVNQERWLVSYADFITLLFAFFVVMYSISQVNQGKYKVLSETFVQAFNEPNDSKANPLPQEQINPSNDAITPIDTGKTATEEFIKTPSVIEDTAKPNATSDSTGSETDSKTKPEENDELVQISNRVSAKFAQLINDQLIKVSSNEFWVQIELNDSILFPSGGVEPSTQAQAIFTEIADVLKNYSNPIQVEGFTDNIPISNSRYPTNWELSATRATEIVKFLSSKGVAPERMAAE